MLRTLRVANLAVLEDVRVEFGPGLNLLTGETGAGKSLLVDALDLVAGARADTALVRAGSSTARVEAEFAIAPGGTVADLLRARGLPAEDGVLIVRREWGADGGRAFVNDSACTLAVLREIAEGLLDLLGQHQNQTLRSRESQRDLLDRFGGLEDRAAGVREAHEEVVRAREQRDALAARRRDAAERAQSLRVQIREIDAVAPEPGELDALDRERNVLRNAEEVAERLHRADARLYSDEGSASSQAAGAARDLAALAGLDPELAALSERLDAARVDLEDIGSAVREYLDRTDFDPARLEEVESRRAALERLRLRYGADEAEVLDYREHAATELAALDGLDGERLRAEEAVDAAEHAYARLAGRLAKERRAAGRRLGKAVSENLRDLAFAAARFEVRFEPSVGERIGGAGHPETVLAPHGGETVEFLLAANPGEPAASLRRSASGGELSRVMLALHGALEARGSGRVLVFDEVDAGVGGAVADVIGRRLARLATRHQVLCVTHLPQIAAHADRHYSVTKDVAGGRTRAGVTELGAERRIEELARMLGGSEPTETSRRHAAELLRAAAGGPDTIESPRRSRGSADRRENR